MIHPTVNAKGSIGAAMVTADLISRGFSVFLPFDGSSPVDLVAANEHMILVRLQVKYRNANRFGSLEVPFQSVVNGKRIAVDLQKIDGWAIFCPETKLVYYVGKRQIDLSKKGFSLALQRHEARPTSRFSGAFLSPVDFWERAIR